MNTLIYEIAKACQWRKTVNENFVDVCEDRINYLQGLLPSGLGIDAGCKIDIQASGKNKVKISFSYHHMDEYGYYDGWTDHVLTVTPSLTGFEMHISGRDRNQIKEYLYCVFDTVLSFFIPE